MKSLLPERVRTWIIRGAIFAIGGGFVLASYLFVYSYYTVKIPDTNAYVNSQATVIEYADGSEIGRVGAEDRTSVPLAAIPMNVRHAIMAAEDRNFYSEHAFSPTGILRALYHDLLGGSLQGGSTITQQYAKTAFLTPQRSIQRKIKEIVIAAKDISQLLIRTLRFDISRGAGDRDVMKFQLGNQLAGSHYFAADIVFFDASLR